MSESKSVEILKMALLMEHRGKAFYKKVAEQSNNEDVKKYLILWPMKSSYILNF